MVSRAFAVWLVLLILLPFSAPFSTCDAATLFGRTEHRSATHPGGPLPPSSLHHDVATRVPTGVRIGSRDRLATEPGASSLELTADAGPGLSYRTTPLDRVSAPTLTPLRL